MSYNAALFCQTFKREFKAKPENPLTIRAAIRRALDDVFTGVEVVHVESLYATMTSGDGRLAPDWGQLIMDNHS